MLFHWKERSRFPASVDAQEVGDWLLRVRDRHDGELTAEIVLAEVERRRTPLYDAITWNNAEAARKHRLAEVRQALNKLSVSRGGQSVRALLPVRRASQPTRYELFDTIMRNSRLREARLQQAYRELSSFHARWAIFPELKDILDTIETHVKPLTEETHA